MNTTKLPAWLQGYANATRDELDNVIIALSERDRENSWHKGDCIATYVIQCEIHNVTAKDVYNNWPSIGATYAMQLAKLSRIYDPSRRDTTKAIRWYQALTELAQLQNDLRYPRTDQAWTRLSQLACLMYDSMADASYDELQKELAAMRRHAVGGVPGVTFTEDTYDPEANEQEDRELFSLRIERTATGKLVITDDNGDHHGILRLGEIISQLVYTGPIDIVGYKGSPARSTTPNTEPRL